MNPVVPNLVPVLPEIFILVMASVILIVDVFAKDNRLIAYALTQVALVAVAWITLAAFNGSTSYTFNHMFIADPVADVLKLLIYVTVLVVLTYSRGYLVRRGLFRGEYFALVLFAMLGMMVMISANHFLVMYLGLELMSLSLYALVALQRDSAAATEAAMKYFVLGALASGLLLYGMSLVYGATGSLYNQQIALAIMQQSSQHHLLLATGLVFIVAGLAFKLGAAPFHMWVPDVYEGSPTAVTLFIGSAPKLAAFAFVLRLLIQGFQGVAADWQGMLVILALLSMAVGNITAIAQTNLKRMLAYSTIAHMGYLLLGFLSGSMAGYSAAMFYAVIYVLMTVGAFGVLLLLSRHGFDAERLEHLKGLNQRSPWYAFIMLLIVFSMAGVPPTVGFYAKLLVFQAAMQAGFTWLVVAAVIFALIGAFYYLRLVKLMYFDEPLERAPFQMETDARVLLSLNGLGILVLGVLPQPLIALCIHSIRLSL
ncbi:MAG TPA: NADH-quinone oxidoreductase subunit NuoN [Betaproteobacteria bacterium]|nr:NADH-quinone oxidoreductase subunit NuoN [Betaproteobacteria bacterium]